MKPNKTTYIIIAVVTIGIAILVYFLFFKKPKQLPPEKLIDKKGVKISWSADEFPLKKLSSGNKVKNLQAGLNILHNANLTTDGKFGDNTLNALKKYYSISEISEADYNKYILANISKINAYLTSRKVVTPAKTTASTTPTATPTAPTPTAATFLKKSIWANDNCTGYVGKEDSDEEFILDETNPIKYNSGQYIGIVEKEQDSNWLRCIKVNSQRVFILKKYAKT